MTTKRTLQATFKLDDKVTSTLTKIQRSIRNFVRRITAPFRSALRTLTSFRTAILGIGLALAARAGAASFQGVIDTTDQLTKLAASTGDAVENLSELRFALQLNGVEASKLEPILVALGRAQSQAIQGQARSVEAFQQLGITIEELRQLGPSRLFEEIARGLEGFSSEQDRAAVLQKLFTENFQRLLPLLGRGVRSFQDSIREGRRYGATITELDGIVSERVNDSFLRLRTSIEGVQRSLITAFGDDTAATLTTFAGYIQENRDEVVRLAKAVAQSLVDAIYAVSEAFIGFASIVQDVQDTIAFARGRETLIERADREAAEAAGSVRRLEQSLAGARATAQVFKLDLDESLDSLRRSVPALERLGVGLRDILIGNRGASTLREAFQAAESRIPDLQRQAASAQERAAGLRAAGDYGDFLRRGRDQFVADVEQSLREIQFGVPVVPELQPGGVQAFASQVGAALSEAFGTAVSVFRGTDQGAGANRLADEGGGDANAPLELAKDYEQLAAAINASGLGSRELLEEQKRLAVEAVQLDLAKSYDDGRISLEEFTRLQGEVAAGQERLQGLADVGLRQEALDAQEAMLQLLPPTERIREELERIRQDRALAQLEADLIASGVAAEEARGRVAALRREIEEAGGNQQTTARTFGEGFTKASAAATDFYTSARAGAEVYGSFQDELLDGLDAWIAGTQKGSEAWKDFTASFVAEARKIILRLIIIRALNEIITGIATSGAGTEGINSAEGPGFTLQVAGAANGGVADGRIQRTMPLRAFANGGISDGPTLAIFGEGKHRREAFVPLPDGRRIPVDMRGQGGGGEVNVSFQINGGDGPSTRRMLKKEEPYIVSMVQRAIATQQSMRDSVGRR